MARQGIIEPVFKFFPAAGRAGLGQYMTHQFEFSSQLCGIALGQMRFQRAIKQVAR